MQIGRHQGEFVDQVPIQDRKSRKRRPARRSPSRGDSGAQAGWVGALAPQRRTQATGGIGFAGRPAALLDAAGGGKV